MVYIHWLCLTFEITRSLHSIQSTTSTDRHTHSHTHTHTTYCTTHTTLRTFSVVLDVLAEALLGQLLEGVLVGQPCGVGEQGSRVYNPRMHQLQHLCVSEERCVGIKLLH